MNYYIKDNLAYGGTKYFQNNTTFFIVVLIFSLILGKTYCD